MRYVRITASYSALALLTLTFVGSGQPMGAQDFSVSATPLSPSPISIGATASSYSLRHFFCGHLHHTS